MNESINQIPHERKQVFPSNESMRVIIIIIYEGRRDTYKLVKKAKFDFRIRQCNQILLLEIHLSLYETHIKDVYSMGSR